MREPKFRGFSKGTNSWHYGFGWCEIDYTDDFLEEKGIEPQAMLYTENGPIECELKSMGEYAGLKDKNGREIYEGDITELEVDGEIRRFVVNIKTVIREVVSHPSFFDETAKVAITGVVFEWNGFELFPCVDENGEFDNSKMIVVGNVSEHPHLLEGDSIENQ